MKLIVKEYLVYIDDKSLNEAYKESNYQKSTINIIIL